MLPVFAAAAAAVTCQSCNRIQINITAKTERVFIRLQGSRVRYLSLCRMRSKADGYEGPQVAALSRRMDRS